MELVHKRNKGIIKDNIMSKEYVSIERLRELLHKEVENHDLSEYWEMRIMQYAESIKEIKE